MTWDEVEEFIDGGEIKDEMAPRGGFGGVEGRQNNQQARFCT